MAVPSVEHHGEPMRFSRRGRRILLGVVICFVVLGLIAVAMRDRNEPELYADVLEHFKYGSIGTETYRGGIPYWIWYVLPQTFADLLPDRPGNGYERFGFVYEPSHTRPIGTSYRRHQVPVVGLNCAACHTGVLRDAAGGPRRIILGMPSHQLDLQSYSRFLFACSRDPRFNATTLIAAIRRQNPDFSWFDQLLYRTVVIPLTKREFAKQAPDYAWLDRGPVQGPGRVNTFNPYKVMFRLPVDEAVGTADFPSVFHQTARRGMRLHWDGNNDLAEERNKSAALGVGCSEASLDLEAMKRVEDWILELPPPPFPAHRIDDSRAARGAVLYRRDCANCHAVGGSQTGHVLDVAAIGTDPERVHSFTPALADKMNTLGMGRPWKFSHFRKTNGYANVLLDGVWLRAPYLHNGSVPTLRDLLNAPDARPSTFYRGYDVYDYVNVGFVSSGSEAARSGFLYRTDVRGNNNAGHLYGTLLSPAEKQDLLEFLKSL
jgi:mono/diheme cytochrome c family protein